MNVRQMVSNVRGLTRAVKSQFAIARLLIQIERAETQATARIERIKEDKTARVKALKVQIVRRAESLFSFFALNRDKLPASPTGVLAKTSAGECEWYPGAPSIHVTDEDAAIAALEKQGVEGSLRRKVELNKDYLLEHPDLVAKIPGIEIVSKRKRTLRFPDTKARVELPDDGPMEIVFPKKKK